MWCGACGVSCVSCARRCGCDDGRQSVCEVGLPCSCFSRWIPPPALREEILENCGRVLWELRKVR